MKAFSFWVMTGLILGLFLQLNVPKAQAQQPAQDALIGYWLGTLDVGRVNLRIVFSIEKEGDGWKATLDSPDQNVFDIPASEVSFQNDTLSVTVQRIGGNYTGEVDAAFQTISGTWRQGGSGLPLNLARVAEKPSPKKPQEPEKPYPYKEEEVTFYNAESAITLAGTLTLPESEGPFPVAILISGSGPQDRDESLMGHKPFLVLADHLTRQGIAVLRHDDRGVGQSGGVFQGATSLDLATDTRAAFQYLKTRPEIDASRIGLVGHSEGGLMGPIVAGQEEVAFLVLLAAPGLRGDQIIATQGALMNRAGGMPDDLVARSSALQQEVFEVAFQNLPPAEEAARVTDIITPFLASLSPEEKAQIGASSMADSVFVQRQVASLQNPWFRFFLQYDPLPALEKVTCPVLAITGEKDLQVPPAENLAAIESTLRASGNENVTTATLPGLNHLFQHADTGLPNEYGTIQETFSPDALSMISSWINQNINQK